MFPLRSEKQTVDKWYLKSNNTLDLINDIFLSNYWDKRNRNAILVDVDQIIVWIKYYKNHIFKDIPSTKQSHIRGYEVNKNIINMANILYSDYHIIYEILRISNGKISLCGGSIVNLITTGINEADWDLFFHCGSVDEANELLNQCLNCINFLDGEYMVFSRSQGVITIKYNNDKIVTIQFILRIYNSKDQVLLGFDLAGSRLGYNLEDGLFATICGKR